MASFRKFTRRFFLISNIVVVFFFLLACTDSFLRPGNWWFISLLGLIFPLLLLIVFAFFIFWLLVPGHRRLALISLVALVLGWTNIHSLLAFNAGSAFTHEKPPNSIRILTWNVRSWDEFITRKTGASGHRSKMMEFVDGQQADILCFQEFFESHKPKESPANIPYIRDRLHYPYFYFSPDHDRYSGLYEGGVVIFSKYPIIHTMHLKYRGLGADTLKAAESLIAADINVNGDLIRIFTTHLQSVMFHSKEFRDIEIIKNVDDSILPASKSIVKKLRNAYLQREEQAGLVREELDKSPYPAIICGDFNDTPNSYTYFTIKGSWQDAFIKKGLGIGRTYVHISPTLRIDYILAHPAFKILQYNKFPLPYSDHNPVVADLELPGKKP